MAINSDLAIWLAVWVFAIAVIFYSQGRRKDGGAGLIMMYVMSLALNHWLGAAIYLLPWYSTSSARYVEVGFEQTTYGVIAFIVGGIIIAPLLMRFGGWAQFKQVSHRPEPRLAVIYLGIGLSCYLVLMPLLGRLPTVTALLSTGWTLTVVGLCLKLFSAWEGRNRRSFWVWAGVTMFLPFMTVITQGFIGYGVMAMIAVLIFGAGFYRPRWMVMAVAIVFTYVGLSVYVTYMRDRSEIRDAVWGGENYSTRFDRMLSTASNPEPFDLYNEDHLHRIDERLNQNHLVGAAVNYLEAGGVEFANGETLWEALIALVPRAIWADKPVVAGSGGLVTKYTGIYFAEGTSVGIGQVMEFYVNFGSTGVVVGFLIIGIILGLIDRFAAVRLMEGDQQGFTLWFLPGLGFLQVGGSLVEVTSTAGSALVVAILVNKVVFGKLRGRVVIQREKNVATGSASMPPAAAGGIKFESRASVGRD